MKKPQLKKIDTLFENRYINVYDLCYEDGRHYYDASRRKKEDLVAASEKPELPDAVSAFVILRCLDGQERLLLFHEYRYPTGQYVLSIPSGLIDEKGKLDLGKAHLAAYSHGTYYSLGKKLGSFGYSVRKK